MMTPQERQRLKEEVDRRRRALVTRHQHGYKSLDKEMARIIQEGRPDARPLVRS